MAQIKTYKLGIVGISEGNGHPYSWSAIFNGFNKLEMEKCPFPIINEYLNKKTFPSDFLGELARVTHVWTQDKIQSEQIAKASKIDFVADSMDELIKNVDAVLFARDDAQNHLKMVSPILEAGLPVFIDKPLAFEVKDAVKMFKSQLYESQIFSCSSLRYASELILSEKEKLEIGDIRLIEGTVMKKWENYGIHILEPIIAQLPKRGKLIDVKSKYIGQFHVVNVQWENCLANLKVTGNSQSDIEIHFYGERSNVKKKFQDSFSCFKTSLMHFVSSFKNELIIIPRKETLEIIEIIEKGRNE